MSVRLWSWYTCLIIQSSDQNLTYNLMKFEIRKVESFLIIWTAICLWGKISLQEFYMWREAEGGKWWDVEGDRTSHLKNMIISMINGKHLCRLESSYEYEQHMAAVDDTPELVLQYPPSREILLLGGSTNELIVIIQV